MGYSIALPLLPSGLLSWGLKKINFQKYIDMTTLTGTVVFFRAALQLKCILQCQH